MAKTSARQHASHPMSYYWDVVKDMDDSQKLELITLLAESIQPKVMAPPPGRRYTMEEINAILDVAEADFAAGKGIPDEEVWRKWDEELAREEQKELELAEAV